MTYLRDIFAPQTSASGPTHEIVASGTMSGIEKTDLGFYTAVVATEGWIKPSERFFPALPCDFSGRVFFDEDCSFFGSPEAPNMDSLIGRVWRVGLSFQVVEDANVFCILDSLSAIKPLSDEQPDPTPFLDRPLAYDLFTPIERADTPRLVVK